MAAYAQKGMDLWGICQRRELIHAGEGAEALQSYLDMLAVSGSAAEYTIRFYDDDVEPSAIRRDTDYHSCYTVKLTDAPLYSGGQQVARVGAAGIDPVFAEVQGMFYKKIAAAVKEEMEGKHEPEEETIGDLLKGLLKKPESLVGIINAIRGFAHGGAIHAPVAMGNVNPPAARIGTQAPPPQQAHKPSPDELMARIAAAIDRLEKCDPNILVNLEKLATLAETNPAMYAMAVKMLG
jgi:hypothetical protein